MTPTHPEKQLVLQAMQNLSFPLCQEVLDDAAQRVARGAIQNRSPICWQSDWTGVCAACSFRAGSTGKAAQKTGY
jgi:hypothetical protein